MADSVSYPYLESIFSQFNIQYIADTCIENEGRLHPIDFSAGHLGPQPINNLFSADALDPINHPRNFTNEDGIPCPLMSEKAVEKGYEVVCSWDVMKREGHSDRFGWMYRNQQDPSMCSNVPGAFFDLRFRVWKRVLVKKEDKHAAKQIIDNFEEFSGKFCNYNVRHICKTLMGLPFRLNVVWENVREKGAPLGRADPPQWTFVKMVKQNERQPLKKTISRKESTPKPEDLDDLSLDEESRTGGWVGGIESCDHELQETFDSNEEEEEFELLEDTISLDMVKRSKNMVANSIFYRIFARENYPYNPLREDSKIAKVHASVPPDWSIVRGFNFCVNPYTDENGWEYSNSFWGETNDTSSEPQETWVSNPAHVKNISPIAEKNQKIRRRSTEALDHIIESSEEIFSNEDLKTVIRATNEMDDYANIKISLQNQQQEDILSLARSHRRRSYNDFSFKADSIVKRRMWCRIICPNKFFTCVYEKFNAATFLMPKGIHISGTVSKIGRGFIKTEKSRFFEVLNDQIRYYSPSVIRGEKGELKGSFSLIDAHVLAKPDKPESVKDGFCRSTIFSKLCDRDSNFQLYSSYAFAMIVHSKVVRRHTLSVDSSDGKPMGASLALSGDGRNSSSVDSALAQSNGLNYDIRGSTDAKAESVEIKSGEGGLVAAKADPNSNLIEKGNGIVPHPNNVMTSASVVKNSFAIVSFDEILNLIGDLNIKRVNRAKLEFFVKKRYKYFKNGKDTTETSSRMEYNRVEAGQKLKLIFKHNGDSGGVEQALFEAKKTRDIWLDVQRNQIALMSQSRIYDVEGFPKIFTTPIVEVVYFNADKCEFEETLNLSRQYVSLTFVDTYYHSEFYAEVERKKEAEDGRKRKEEEEKKQRQERKETELKREENVKVAASLGRHGPQKIDTNSNYVTSRKGILVPITLIKGSVLSKKYSDERSYRSRCIWIDQLSNGTWAMFWSKEGLKTKEIKNSKSVSFSDISRAEVGFINDPEPSPSGRPTNSSVSRSKQSWFHNEEKGNRTMTIYLKTNDGYNFSGIDIEFNSAEEAYEWHDIIQRLLLE